MALRDYLRLKKKTIEDYDFHDDCDYVVIPPSHVSRYKSEGWKEVVQSLTVSDGLMSLMERKR